jgi:hypothetical protein
MSVNGSAPQLSLTIEIRNCTVTNIVGGSSGTASANNKGAVVYVEGTQAVFDLYETTFGNVTVAATTLGGVAYVGLLC